MKVSEQVGLKITGFKSGQVRGGYALESIELDDGSVLRFTAHHHAGRSPHVEVEVVKNEGEK